MINDFRKIVYSKFNLFRYKVRGKSIYDILHKLSGWKWACSCELFVVFHFGLRPQSDTWTPGAASHTSHKFHTSISGFVYARARPHVQDITRPLHRVYNFVCKSLSQAPPRRHEARRPVSFTKAVKIYILLLFSLHNFIIYR